MAMIETRRRSLTDEQIASYGRDGDLAIPRLIEAEQVQAIPDVVAELIGPAIRFHHSKLNLKGSLIGAPVEVHQDAAFYPHSNDDVLAAVSLVPDTTGSPRYAQFIRGTAPTHRPPHRGRHAAAARLRKRLHLDLRSAEPEHRPRRDGVVGAVKGGGDARRAARTSVDRSGSRAR